MWEKQMEKVKEMGAMDWALIKFAVAFGTLTLITYVPPVMEWVQNTNRLYFLIATMVFGATPFYKIYIKK